MRNFDLHQSVMARVHDTAKPLLSIAPDAGFPVAEQPQVAVCGRHAFDSWQQLREALQDLRARGLILDSFNCMALQRLFAGKTIVAPNQEPVGVEALPFLEDSELIACTSGPLADRLLDQIDSGATDLKDALGRWLMPRHAAHFDDAARAGKILFWIRVSDEHDERRAYQTLLVHSSNSVGVHDLMGPGE